MNSIEEIKDIIKYSTGTEAYHKFSPIEGFPVITDGVFKVAEAAECYWLLDLIGSYQINPNLDPEFQVWKLKVCEDQTATASGYNDLDLIIEQKIEYTDFPLDSFEVYLVRGVILLPGEY